MEQGEVVELAGVGDEEQRKGGACGGGRSAAGEAGLALTKGELDSLARRRAISVLPQPVGPARGGKGVVSVHSSLLLGWGPVSAVTAIP
jgi:hypothetical protein